MVHRTPEDLFTDHALMDRTGLLATPVRQCLESLATRHDALRAVDGLDQLPVPLATRRGTS